MPPFRLGYPARLPDGRFLVLPIRERPGGERAVAFFAMRQGNAWRDALGAIDPQLPSRVHGVFDTPLLLRDPEGWVPEPRAA